MAVNFPNSPAINDIFTSGSSSWKWDGVKWVPLSGSAILTGNGMNILRRNGGFEIWQRGAGGAASFNPVPASTFNYGADGWYLVTGANQASAFQQLAGLTNGSQFSGRITRLSGQVGATTMALGYPLDSDELFPMLGQFVRLSFTAKAGTIWSPAAGALTAGLYVGTGAPAKVFIGFTGQSNPVLGTVNLTQTATRYQINSTVIVPVNTRQADVSFTWTPVGTAGVDDSWLIDDVQLEIVPAASGYISSDFQRLNFNEQLRLCQRHFWKTFDYDVAPASNLGWGIASPLLIAQPSGPGTQYYGASYPSPVPMRVVPTAIGYNPGAAGNQMQCGVINQPYTSTAFGLYKNAIMASGITPAGSAIGYPGSVHFIVDAGI